MGGLAGARSQAGETRRQLNPALGCWEAGQGWQPLCHVLPASRRLPSVLCQGGPWRWSTGPCQAPSRGRDTERSRAWRAAAHRSAPNTRDTGHVPPGGCPSPQGSPALPPWGPCTLTTSQLWVQLVGLGGTPGSFRACCHPWAVPIASWCSRDEGLKAWARGRSVCLRGAASQPPCMHTLSLQPQPGSSHTS